MARVLNVGRWGVDVLTANPRSIQWRGHDAVQIEGQIKDVASMEEALVLRDQLLGQQRKPGYLGLVNVYTTLDHSIDGFYILESANVSALSSLGSFANAPGVLPYSMVLRPLNTVMFESVISGAVLDNDHSKTTGSPFIAPPTIATSISPFGGVFPNHENREHDRMDDDAAYQALIPVYFDVTPPDFPVWTCAPRDYLAGAATLFCNGYVITGHPVFSYYINSPTQPPYSPNDWVLSNGIVRLTSGALGKFTLELFNDGSWEGASEFQFLVGNVSAKDWIHLQVLRNDPEEVAIRLFYNLKSFAGRVTLDLSIRRGSAFVRGYATANSGSSTPLTSLDLGRTTSDPATSFDYGIHDSSLVDNHRWVIGSRTTMTENLTTGYVVGDSNGSGGFLEWDFYLGMVRENAGLTNFEGAEGLGDQYLHHIAEQVYPVVPGGILL